MNEKCPIGENKSNTRRTGGKTTRSPDSERQGKVVGDVQRLLLLRVGRIVEGGCE